LFVAEVLPVVHLRHQTGIYRSSGAPARFCYQIISFLPQLSPQGNSSTGLAHLWGLWPCRPRPDQGLQMVRNIACRNENFTTALPAVAIADVRTWPPCREGGPRPRPIIDAFNRLSERGRPAAMFARRHRPVFQGEAPGHPFAATAFQFSAIGRIDERILACLADRLTQPPGGR
jgi:hypothetical protein